MPGKSWLLLSQQISNAELTQVIGAWRDLDQAQGRPSLLRVCGSLEDRDAHGCWFWVSLSASVPSLPTWYSGICGIYDLWRMHWEKVKLGMVGRSLRGFGTWVFAAAMWVTGPHQPKFMTTAALLNTIHAAPHWHWKHHQQIKKIWFQKSQRKELFFINTLKVASDEAGVLSVRKKICFCWKENSKSFPFHFLNI